MLAGLRKLRRKWTKHLLFVEAETSCNLTISLTDPKVPLADGLTNLVREAKVLDLRLRMLDNIGSTVLGEQGEKHCTMERLISFIDEPVACETASTMLRHAASQLEREVRDLSSALVRVEDEAPQKRRTALSQTLKQFSHLSSSRRLLT